MADLILGSFSIGLINNAIIKRTKNEKTVKKIYNTRN